MDDLTDGELITLADWGNYISKHHSGSAGSIIRRAATEIRRLRRQLDKVNNEANRYFELMQHGHPPD